MRTLTPAERRARRAAAHHLHPVVAIGQHGLTAAVLAEIEVALKAHELIKVRVFDGDRAAREALLVRICEALDAAPVQHLGKILTVWRPAPAPPPVPAEPRRHAKPRPAVAARAGADRTRKGKGVGAKPAGDKRPAAPPGARGRGPVPGARRRRRSV